MRLVHRHGERRLDVAQARGQHRAHGVAFHEVHAQGHKSQGSEFRHTVLVLPEDRHGILTRELVYTGITRASAEFTLVSPAGSVLAEAVARRTHRASGLRALLGG
ncbi:MAG TPA: hypothetical protein DDZ22_09820 [Massilia sp.]|nr:hypothetical protein [Massilia sp.]